MPIVNPTVDKQYLLQKSTGGRKPLVSSMEIAAATAPEYIGEVVLPEIAKNTYLGFLLAQGNEITIASDQFRYNESEGTNIPLSITGRVVKRTDKDFTIDATKIPSDPYDFDSSRPTKLQFIVEVGMEFTAIDATGKMNYGKITAINSDSTVITADRVDTDTDWDIASADLEIIFTGYNLDHCECPPCIGYKDYSPAREQSFFKTGVCLEWCDEEVIATGGGSYEPYNTKDGEYWLDTNLDRKMTELSDMTDNALAFARRLTAAQATAKGSPRGTMGIFQILDNRATKFQGKITAISDLSDIAALLEKEGVYEAALHCTPEQYTALMDLLPRTNYQWDPFVNHQNDLMYLGYKGIDVNGVKLIFTKWNAFTGKHASLNLAKKYNFLITPMGKLKRTVAGKTEEVGYANVAWFGNERKVYKNLRVDNGIANCDKFKIEYVNKFAPVIFFPEKFIVGIN